MIRGVVLDLDGTVYLSGRVLPGVAAAIDRLRDAGLAIVFVSNNPTVPAAAYAAKLTGLGIAAEERHVITSGGLAAAWLAEQHPGAQVLTVAEDSLRGELADAGVAVTVDPTEADVVLVSFDRTFDYAKWRAAFDALNLGAVFVATNPDATCPIDGGALPDCAGIIAALEATTGRRLDAVVGKPSAITARAALNRLSDELRPAPPLSPHEVLVAGDRLETDVALGLDAGMVTALMLSGVTDRSRLAASDLTPDHVLAGLADLPDAILPAVVGTDAGS